MSHILTFSDQTISKVNEELWEKGEIYVKLDINEVKEIVSTLDKNDELNRKPLKKIKTEKINYLNFKPKSPSPSEENK